MEVPMPNEPTSALLPVDSGMSSDAVVRAELLWANLPTGKPWTSLSTAEKALVCHTLARLEARPTSTDPEVAALVERLEADLALVQEGERPLPWVVHSGCSYRRIASEPTRENMRTFADGNVLSAYNQRSDGHPDLSMPEHQLEALVRLVNALPALITRLSAKLQEADHG
jgi:hypothetical protein